MKKYPNIQLLVLAGLVGIVGYFITKPESGRPRGNFFAFLLVAGALVVIAVASGLMKRPPRIFGPYRWPGYTPTGTILLLLGAAAAVVLVGLVLSSLPVTCGGQQMRPGDQCVDYTNGGSASYRDVETAPITQLWIYLLIAAALVIAAIGKLIRRRPPTTEEVAAFETEVAAIRERFVIVAYHPAYRRAIADPQEWLKETLAQFEQDVEDERRRAGIALH